MKYSIRGKIKTDTPDNIMNKINEFTLWRLITNSYVDEEDSFVFSFEVWVNSLEDKTDLFNDLKPFVGMHTGELTWHECTHDEPNPRPCEIVETYKVGD